MATMFYLATLTQSRYHHTFFTLLSQNMDDLTCINCYTDILCMIHVHIYNLRYVQNISVNISLKN